jgi:nucleoside-diphosphate-sugar epimerase
MKVLVTGATGFLGSHIVESLIRHGHEVRALARRTSNLCYLEDTGAEVVFGDVMNYDSLFAAADGVDIIIHAAGIVMPGWGKWGDYEDANVSGTKNALVAGVEAGAKRFVYVSSTTVLGKAGCCDVPADESTPYDLACTPDSYYDYAKMLGEQVALDYHKYGRIPVTVVRPAMIYGPRDRYLADRMHWAVNLPISFFPGKGNPKAPLVYVSDVADCIVLAAMNEQAVGEIYNVAPSEDVRFRDLTLGMAKALGKPYRNIDIPLWLMYISGVLMEWWGKLWRFKHPPLFTRAAVRFFKEEMNIDGSKARRELGWEPKVSIEEGCRLYVQWRRTQSNGKKGASDSREMDLVGQQE